MKYKLFVKTVTGLVEVIFALVTLIIFTAFALKPTELTLLTDSLILIMILVQLFAVNVLTDIYDKLDAVKRK